MKKISLVFGLLVVLCTYSKAQDTCTPKRIFEYTDESKKTIIIKELLVYSKQEKKYLPFTYAANLFLKTPAQGGPALGIRFFNFACIKTRKNGKLFWKGQVCMDLKQHAIFKTPVMGIRGFIELAITYIDGSYNTLYKFFNRYAPADDCIGSVKKILVNGKWVCPECCPNNQPEKYAERVAKGIGIGINDPIKIRDGHGNLSAKLFALLLAEVVKFEIGLDCKFEEEIIKQAIAEL